MHVIVVDCMRHNLVDKYCGVLQRVPWHVYCCCKVVLSQYCCRLHLHLDDCEGVSGADVLSTVQSGYVLPCMEGKPKLQQCSTSIALTCHTSLCIVLAIGGMPYIGCIHELCCSVTGSIRVALTR
jgi:hypothetical protein